jgi:hypothetical protein
LSTSRIAIGSTIDSGELITAYGAAEAAIVFQNTNSGTGAVTGLYLGTLNAENYLWTYEDQPVIFGSNNTEQMRLTSAGVLELAQGQIQFPATQVASANANTLDDYEEGTWTPAYTASGGGSAIHTIQTGTYTKIGNVVTCSFRITANKDTLSGDISITGLPFTTASTNSSALHAARRFATDFVAFGSAFGTSLFLYKDESSAVSATSVTDADLVAGTNYNDLTATFTYTV